MIKHKARGSVNLRFSVFTSLEYEMPIFTINTGSKITKLSIRPTKNLTICSSSDSFKVLTSTRHKAKQKCARMVKNHISVPILVKRISSTPTKRVTLYTTVCSITHG